MFPVELENDSSYTGVAMGRVINVLKDGRYLVIRNATVEEFAEIWFVILT